MTYEKEELTFNQQIIRSIIIDLRNELIGGTENAYEDSPEEWGDGKLYNSSSLTKEWAINTIYDLLVGGTEKYVQSPIRNIAIEKKHIKFYGEKWIKGLIEDRVEHDFNKNGWAFPNNYYAN